MQAAAAAAPPAPAEQADGGDASRPRLRASCRASARPRPAPAAVLQRLAHARESLDNEDKRVAERLAELGRQLRQLDRRHRPRGSASLPTTARSSRGSTEEERGLRRRRRVGRAPGAAAGRAPRRGTRSATARRVMARLTDRAAELAAAARPASSVDLARPGAVAPRSPRKSLAFESEQIALEPGAADLGHRGAASRRPRRRRSVGEARSRARRRRGAASRRPRARRRHRP